MAAIDPTEEPVTNGETHPRATLKLIRTKFPPDEDDDDLDYDSDDIDALERRLAMADDDDSEDDEDDEMVNGGPSDPERARKLLREALSKAKSLDEDEDDDDDDDGVEPKTLQTGVNGIFKGKGKAIEMDDDDDDGVQEFVVCTLDSKQVSGFDSYVLA
jgi:FK506-binding nuclear protein